MLILRAYAATFADSAMLLLRCCYGYNLMPTRFAVLRMPLR